MEQLLTADGIPLKVSLKKAYRREKLSAFLLVAPLLLFIVVTFLIPIVDMLMLSVDNSIVPEILPRTTKNIQTWDPHSGELPGEEIFEAFVKDLKEAKKNRTHTRVGQRLNYESSGLSSLFRSSGRKIKRIRRAPFKAALIKIDKRWGELKTWQILHKFSTSYTPAYYFAATDTKLKSSGEFIILPDEERIYSKLFLRTMLMSALITGLTLLIGFPVAYLLAILPTKIGNLLIILVLLPFWTSLLVRTCSWIALLQQHGVINDTLVSLGLLGEDERIAMIHNATGTVIAMTHILLPFMILPLYSVMKTIPKSFVRAAVSLGAHPWVAFWKVYFPNTVAGIGAGSILVFILSIGYYITPELVGGNTGTFISNRIAYSISISLNWGLAAALGVILLGIVIAFYILYDRIVGIDKMRLG